MSVVMGVTGNIATGKTFFCNVWQSLYPETVLFNADLVSKKILHSNEDIIDFILKITGIDILDNNDKYQINYKKFAEIIFNDQNLYKKIVPTIHEAVTEELKEFIEGHKNSDYILIESAVLKSVMWDKYCDKVIELCPSSEKLEINYQKRGISHEAVLSRLNKQITSEEYIYIMKEDIIILTDITISSLRKIQKTILKKNTI